MEAQADRMHTRFKDPDSDFIVLLNIWNRYHDVWNTLKTQNRMRKFCKEHFLSYRRMREWKDIYNEISAILKEEAKTGAFEQCSVIPDDSQSRYSRIHRSILSGHLSNIATKKEKNIYTAAGGREVMIFPGSGLFGSGGSWIIAAQMVETSRLFARVVANIDSDWLEELGGHLCRYTYSGPHWARDRGEVVASEQVSLYGLIIVQGRPVSYGRINPDEASGIFIRSALVEGDMGESPSFLVHNRGLIEEISGMEDKIRRRDILVGEDALFQFYEKRLGGVYDVRTLRKTILDRGGDDFLKMRKEDVLQYFPNENDVSLYPDELVIKGRKLQCSYRFDPGKPDDGITLKVPATFATIPAESTQWLVPGLLREKITMLIKGLPKEFRKKLVPIPKTVDIIMSEMERGKGSIISALGRFIYEKFDLNIPASAWSPDALPDYVKMRFSIVDPEGRELCSGRNVGLLKKNISSEVELPGFDRVKSVWEKRGLTMWNFSDLPESIALNGTNNPEVYAYPALEKQEDGCVDLRLFKDERNAQNAHVKGVKALCEIHFKKELKFLKRLLILQGDMKRWANYFGGARHLQDALYERVSRHLFQKNIRTEAEFLSLVESAGPKILLKGQEVLNEVGPVLKAYHDTRTTFHTMETTNRSNRTVLAFLAGLRKDLERLLPKRFLELYKSERLEHMVRYLKALAIRAERGLFHLEKDGSRAREIKIFVDQLQDFLNNLPDDASDEKKRAIEEYNWMIEEYKISLFAQELKTPFPVSGKRLEKKIGEIERMV
jgi:ATP-dependent helicase HrpA